MSKTLHITVSGKVQGVWFRAWTREQAEELGISGWVRNLPSGEVEVLARADDKTMDRFVELLHQGSPPSRVDSVRTEDTDRDPGVQDFEIRY